MPSVLTINPSSRNSHPLCGSHWDVLEDGRDVCEDDCGVGSTNHDGLDIEKILHSMDPLGPHLEKLENPIDRILRKMRAFSGLVDRLPFAGPVGSPSFYRSLLRVSHRRLRAARQQLLLHDGIVHQLDEPPQFLFASRFRFSASWLLSRYRHALLWPTRSAAIRAVAPTAVYRSRKARIAGDRRALVLKFRRIRRAKAGLGSAAGFQALGCVDQIGAARNHPTDDDDASRDRQVSTIEKRRAFCIELPAHRNGVCVGD